MAFMRQARRNGLDVRDLGPAETSGVVWWDLPCLLSISCRLTEILCFITSFFESSFTTWLLVALSFASTMIRWHLDEVQAPSHSPLIVLHWLQLLPDCNRKNSRPVNRPMAEMWFTAWIPVIRCHWTQFDETILSRTEPVETYSFIFFGIFGSV